jgi:hypothetical protein
VNDAEFATEVARIKAAAIGHGRRVGWSLAALLIAGVLVGTAVWFMADPRDRDNILAGAAMGLGLATFFLGGLLSRTVFPRPKAECPRCGCDWNIESGNDIQQWLNWHCCPGCGLKMSCDVVPLEKP